MIDLFNPQNRWWKNPSAVNADPHLLRLDSAPHPWTPPLPFRFDRDVVYTLRGPRYVGKSTLLKRQIRQLIGSGWPTRHILYLDCELAGIDRPEKLKAALRAFRSAVHQSADSSCERVAIFLDEALSIQGWEEALRWSDDDGLVGATIVASGSDARNRRSEARRLLGFRGGEQTDLVLLPMCFREYVELVSPGLFLPSLVSLEPAEVFHQGQRLALAGSRLHSLFNRYLRSGGFPLAVNVVAKANRLDPGVFRIHRDAILGAISRAGLREEYLRVVVNWAALHLGREFQWRGLAAEAGIGSPTTGHRYVEELQASFIWEILPRSPSLDSPAPSFRGPKKLLPSDPLLWHLLRAWAIGDPDPWQGVDETVFRPGDAGRLAAAVVLVHLRRAFGPRTFYWRQGGQEIDCVVGLPIAACGRALVKVKHHHLVEDADLELLRQNGGGLLLSLDELRLAEGNVAIVPTAYFLASLEEAGSLGGPEVNEVA